MNRRFEELDRNQISNMLEPGMSELMHRLKPEHTGRPMEYNAMHQILTMMIHTADQAGQRKSQIQGKENWFGFAEDAPHAIELNQSGVSSPMPANSHSTRQRVRSPRSPRTPTSHPCGFY